MAAVAGGDAVAPLVSVVMPVRDGGELITEAARSILEQSFCDLELVIVDDGSTAPTKAVLDRLRVTDIRVVVLDQGRSVGIAPALNAGCAAARGRYLARMDADDVSLPDRLARQVALLERAPEIGLVGGQMIATDLRGVQLWPATYPIDDDAIRGTLGSANPFGHPTVVMRKTVFEACGGYRDSCPHAEDYDLWVRMLDRCRAANVPEPVLLYRIHPGQTAFRDWRQHCISTLAVQVAITIRRAGGCDPLDGVELVSESTLLAMGVSEEAVRVRYVESLLALSNLAGHAGSRVDRHRLLSQAQAEAARGPIPPETSSRLALVRALAAFEERELARGLQNLLRSLQADRRAATALAGDWLYRRHRRIFRAIAGFKQVMSSPRLAQVPPRRPSAPPPSHGGTGRHTAPRSGRRG
ncbi:MAG: glycosyltransferase [Solirubrobacteraceae bacterium]